MRARLTLLIAALVLSAALGHGGEPEGRRGGVRGRVVLDVDGVGLAAVGPLVVYLDAVTGELPYRVPEEVPRISQRDAQFSPAFLVVARGQTVEMPNDDSIFHNVFSYSKPNELDLGLYPKGEWRSITFRAAGVVRLYCSIHESMSATIFVAPSPFHAVVGPAGAFALAAVPAGAYRLRTWNQMLPEAGQTVEVVGGHDTEVELHVGGGGPAG